MRGKKTMGRNGRLFLLCSLLMVALAGAVPSRGWAVVSRWGAQIDLQGRGNAYGEAVTGEGESDKSLALGSGTLRVKNTLGFTPRYSFVTHYEAVQLLSDTDLFALPGRGWRGATPSEERNLFDLDSVIREGDKARLSHRLDRFFFADEGDKGSLRLGRQVLTWGNGLIFNPMDIINPFAPSDTIRDYKVGSDMAVYQVWGEVFTDFQAVYLPGRNPKNGEVETSASSAAVKMALPISGTDLELMGAYHMDDWVGGAGTSGYLGGAAWRSDLTWTVPGEGAENPWFTGVVNLDRSFVVSGHNVYALAEFYFNGLGANDRDDALKKPELIERLERGELYNTGRYYLASQAQFEAHPLVNLYLDAILNLGGWLGTGAVPGDLERHRCRAVSG